MSARMELEDLPPRYRAQAEKQIAARCARKAPAGAVSLEAAAKAAGEIGKTFESKGEYDFYIGTVLPGIQSGRIIKATPHVAFPLLPAKDFCAVHLPAARYTADYVLEYADGTVEVVEIKSKFTRRAQRDYTRHPAERSSDLASDRRAAGLCVPGNHHPGHEKRDQRMETSG